MTAKSFQVELEKTETENSINSAVSYSYALSFINKIKTFNWSIDTINSLNYLSKIEDKIFSSKENKTI